MKFITSFLPLLLATTALSKQQTIQGKCIEAVANFGCNMSSLVAELTLDHFDYTCDMYKLEECQYLQYYGIRDIDGCTDDDPSIYEYDDYVTRVLDQVEFLCSVFTPTTTTTKKPVPTSTTKGRCGPNFGACANEGECCSKSGYCGKTVDHCTNGCQSEFGKCVIDSSDIPVSVVLGRCGPYYGSCANPNECCNAEGYCGTTSEYCNACQLNYGKCKNASALPTTTAKIDIGATPTNSNPIKGRCGPTFGKCGEYECCSQYGYCGVTDAHCGEGCQTNYGLCVESLLSSKKSSMLKTTTTVRKNVPTSTVDGRCGPKFGACADPNECCSEYGYCDVSPEHCGAGCQPDYGVCDANVAPIKTTTTVKKVTTTVKKNVPTSTVDGRCGPKFGACADPNECCSQYGYCDASPEHCGAGCQPDYGVCDANTNVAPVKTITTVKKVTTTTIKKNVPTSTVDGRCGPVFGACADPNECCSEYGYCDVSPDHCGVGCQPNYGICDDDSISPPPPPPDDDDDIDTPEKIITPANPDIPLSSTIGRCGPLFGRCSNESECCSEYGYCGITPEHCYNNCQEGYGLCKYGEETEDEDDDDLPFFSLPGRCGVLFGECEEEDECCSEYGYCGKTEEHCTNGCQP
jgi:hypothetical protein